MRLKEPGILIVDDSEGDVALLRMALSREGVTLPIDVLHAGREAITRLAKTDPLPKLILLDGKLPDIPGLEVLRFLRSDERFKDTAIVVLTSFERLGDLQRAHELGADYLTKPVVFSDFQLTIREIKRRWLQ